VPDADLPAVTYIGGPTALLEWHGRRILTDPTFDPAGTVYELPGYILRKTRAPAISAAQLGTIDAALLSHDHHLDNLDHAGRALLATVPRVLTTTAGAERLGSTATGLDPWDTVGLAAPDGATIRVSATPARHGPAGGDRGPVIGFALNMIDQTRGGIYFSGDTVLYDGVNAVIDRYEFAAALLCLGAAHVAAVPSARLTFDATEAVEFALAMPSATIMPLHYEGWEHLSENRSDIDRAFAAAGIADRLHWPANGERTTLRPAGAQPASVGGRRGSPANARTPGSST
jgi:L-ascorbate metabolism protein UlaG (beta-lactamase superfamily)